MTGIEQLRQSPIRFVAIGDSFTEGVGDERPDGSLRGWADLLAQGLADATGETVAYANLAIRGHLLNAIVEGQLEPALELEPTLVSFNGGGNDMLRPRTDMKWIIEKTHEAITRIEGAGAEPLFLSGADPTAGIPAGARVRIKGDALTAAAEQLTNQRGVRFTNNWHDSVLTAPQYWSADRLHLAPVGHHRVAANVLRTLGHEVPNDWVTEAAPLPPATRMAQLRYTREHVLPWIGRRLTGRSSGDGRTAKQAEWVAVHPRR